MTLIKDQFACAAPVHSYGSTAPSDASNLSTAAAVILGDIGGTNARFELAKANLNTGERVDSKPFVKIYPTKDYPTFHGALAQFLAEPEVLNDFVAVGYAIPLFDASKLTAVHDAPRESGGPIAVLGPGTGLGEVQLIADERTGEYRALASEGSHAGFAPRGPRQRALLEFAEAELDPMPCEVEHVACGAGLKRIHRFCCHEAGRPAENLAPKDITERALSGACPVCGAAVDLFLDIVGAEAGAMALRLLATGGIFVAGGILPKMLPQLAGERADRLRRAYLNESSRFTTQLQKWPLFVLQEEAGLRGVFHYAMILAKRVEQHAVAH